MRLWWSATEIQKKHEWNELELLVRSVTKLQPHFITPWLFQSWNLAYNVAVESDRVKDKYFYITRGIELLAEGERQNRNNPDMRFTMGFYNQHKIGLADKANTLRSLFQMSCIPPVERDPNALRMRNASGQIVVDIPKFEEFCAKHPFFVRRLRDYLKCEYPEDVVEFLAANQKLPGWYEEEPIALGGLSKVVNRPKQDETQRFPVLPPSSERDPNDPLREEQELGDDVDNFGVARCVVYLRPGTVAAAGFCIGGGSQEPRPHQVPHAAGHGVAHLPGLSRSGTDLRRRVPGERGLV